MLTNSTAWAWTPAPDGPSCVLSANSRLGRPPNASPPAFPESRGLQGHPPGTLSAPMIVTEQLALPASNRAREHCSAPPPAAEARPGPRVPPALVRAATPPAATQGRLPAVPWGQGRHTGKATTAALGRSAGGASRPFPGPSGARDRHQHGPKFALTYCCPFPAALVPSSRPPSASPPDLTRGHLTPAPAPCLSPVNGDAERKECSAYARSEPNEPVTNKKGSSDHLANHLGAARPGGATSRTVALTTSHSSHQCSEPAPHHLSPWLGQPIASRVPALGPAYWSKSCGDASMEAA